MNKKTFRRRLTLSTVRTRAIRIHLFPARWAQGPLRAHSFRGFIFAFCLVIFLLHSCSCIFDEVELHFGSMLASFSMFLHGIDFTWIRHQFCHDLFMFFERRLLIFIVLHPIGETFKNICFYNIFAWVTLSHTHFVSLYSRHVRCIFLHRVLNIFYTNIGIILVYFWNQN